MSDQDSNVLNFEGGSSSYSSDVDFSGGSSLYANPPFSIGETGSSGDTAGKFLTRYTNIALLKNQFPRIDATFRDFNDPQKIKIVGESLKVFKQAETVESLNLSSFFHFLQNFSEYQKQTFVIAPRTTINLDPSSFSSTNGEVSLILTRAYYLPEAVNVEDRILFWDYKGNTRNPMGQFMILTGAVKNGSSWYGWDINPFGTYDHSDDPNISLGGISFTNPTELNVKITILVAS